MGAVDYGLFASPEYLRNHSLPTDPGALCSHRLIAFAASSQRKTWHLHSQVDSASFKLDLRPRLLANNSLAVRTALVAGVGIGPLPLFFAAREVSEGRRKVKFFMDQIDQPRRVLDLDGHIGKTVQIVRYPVADREVPKLNPAGETQHAGRPGLRVPASRPIRLSPTCAVWD